MIPIIGSLLSGLLVWGGGLCVTGRFPLGITIITFASISQGWLFAAAADIRRSVALGEGLQTDGLTVIQLKTYVMDHAVANATPIYIGTDQGLQEAMGAFHCLLDGRRTLVIERKG